MHNAIFTFIGMYLKSKSNDWPHPQTHPSLCIPRRERSPASFGKALPKQLKLPRQVGIDNVVFPVHRFYHTTAFL